MSTRRLHPRITAAILIAAGALFTIYPALRPYTDETTLAGAAAFASTDWVLSHTAAIIGFILLATGIRAVTGLVGGLVAEVSAILTWLGGSLVLPYYGAEAFGLQVIGARAVADGDASLLELADAFRYSPVPITLFCAGLVLLGAAGVLLAITLWSASTMHRVAGVLIGLGLVGFLPQFFAGPGVRMTHGMLLGLGCLILAVAQLRTSAASWSPRTEPRGSRQRRGSAPPAVPGR